MTKILGSLNQPNKIAWASILEPYLPENLQRKGFQKVEGDEGGSEMPVPVKDLYIWLAEARKVKEPKGDILTYLAIEEGRHDAVLWVVEEVLKGYMNPPEFTQSRARQLRGRPDRACSSLEGLTRSSDATQAMMNMTAFSASGLEPLTEHASRDTAHKCRGEIWRSIGSMVLQAADRAPASAESKSIMICVHRLLAHLHHVGAIPSSIYNYTPAKDPSVLQRPPTIYYWSLRIMTVISDASWTSLNASAQENEDAPGGCRSAESTEMLNMSRVEMSSMMPEVEPQIWLDFVLWCCVEGGWITEAAEITYQMWARRGEGLQYSVIDFKTLSEQHAPKLPWSARIKASIRRSRMRETAGGQTFGSYSDRIGYLKPPERTVSSEVVAAIVDGLVSTASLDPNLFGNKHSVVEKYISVCKILLERKRFGLGSTSWNSIVLRTIESLSTDPKSPQTLIEPIVSWSPPLLQEPFATNSAYRSESGAQRYVTDPSAISLGLLQRLLSDFSFKGDLRGALRIFRRLQDIVDTNRKASLASFPSAVTLILQQDGEGALMRKDELQEAPGLNLQLPPHIIAPFLDLITQAKEFGLGNWLLHSDDVDGCIIPPRMYADEVLQPALIRFASAAGDEQLLDSVTQHLQAPIPEAALRALLHHQIHCERWDAAREILELSRDSDLLAWEPADVIALACTVLSAERDGVSLRGDYLRAQSPAILLKALLRGEYNRLPNPSRPRDLSETRMLHQLARVIASVPSKLSQELLPFCSRERNVLSASCTIPTKAFNILLETVVDLHGIVQGKLLCETWCVRHIPASPPGRVDQSDAELVVEPNVQTFYHLLRPLSKAMTIIDQARSTSCDHPANEPGKSITRGIVVPRVHKGDLQKKYCFDDQERSVVDWSIARCLDLGLRWKDIKQDLPGLAMFGRNTHSVQAGTTTGRTAEEDGQDDTCLTGQHLTRKEVDALFGDDGDFRPLSTRSVPRG
ncbi:MAG: hypothetical protein Q9207_007684 [Kuettlingeria erythrocarpa]